MRVVFCKLFCSETNSEKWKRNFTTYDFVAFYGETNRPKVLSSENNEVVKCRNKIFKCKVNKTLR